MAGLRQTYKIKEFQTARRALDGYYSALDALAQSYKARESQETLDALGREVVEARRRLGRALQGLKFDLVDSMEDTGRASVVWRPE